MQKLTATVILVSLLSACSGGSSDESGTAGSSNYENLRFASDYMTHYTGVSENHWLASNYRVITSNDERELTIDIKPRDWALLNGFDRTTLCKGSVGSDRSPFWLPGHELDITYQEFGEDKIYEVDKYEIIEGGKGVCFARFTIDMPFLIIEEEAFYRIEVFFTDHDSGSEPARLPLLGFDMYHYEVDVTVTRDSFDNLSYGKKLSSKVSLNPGEWCEAQIHHRTDVGYLATQVVKGYQSTSNEVEEVSCGYRFDMMDFMPEYQRYYEVLLCTSDQLGGCTSQNVLAKASVKMFFPTQEE